MGRPKGSKNKQQLVTDNVPPSYHEDPRAQISREEQLEKDNYFLIEDNKRLYKKNIELRNKLADVINMIHSTVNVIQYTIKSEED